MSYSKQQQQRLFEIVADHSSYSVKEEFNDVDNPTWSDFVVRDGCGDEAGSFVCFDELLDFVCGNDAINNAVENDNVLNPILFIC